MRIITKKSITKNKNIKLFKLTSNKDLSKIKSNSFGNGKVKVLTYNSEVKKILSNLSRKESNPGLIETINKISKQNYDFSKKIQSAKKINSYKDPLGRFFIKIIPTKCSVYGVKEKGNSNFQLFELITKTDGKLSKYFLKEYRNNMASKFNATNELLLLKFMEKEGINIIKPQFAFDNINFGNLLSRSFIAYDFSDLYTLRETITGKNPNFKLNKLQIEKIESKLIRLKYHFESKNNISLIDVFEHNIFVKKEKNNIKLYFFDVYSNLHLTEMYSLAKKKGIV